VTLLFTKLGMSQKW